MDINVSFQIASKCFPAVRHERLFSLGQSDKFFAIDSAEKKIAESHPRRFEENTDVSDDDYCYHSGIISQHVHLPIFSSCFPAIK
jgi:hypothetical protein